VFGSIARWAGTSTRWFAATVRARLVPRTAKGGPRVLVFVHNPEPAPTMLFKIVEASLILGAKGGPAGAFTPGIP
jgi:hypothetical protein